MKPRATELGHPRYDRSFPGIGRQRRLDLRVKVYVLVDPRDCTVRYVGQTVDPGRRRMHHRSSKRSGNRLVDAWKAELRKLDLRPLFAVVDSANDELASDLEGSWIAYYRRFGRIHNVLAGGNSMPCIEPTDQEVDRALRRLKKAQRHYRNGHLQEVESFLRMTGGRKTK